MASSVAFLPICVVGYGALIPGWRESCMGGLAALAVMCLVVPPAYGLGSAFGVYLVGTRGNQTGSLLATLGGGIVGLGVMALLCFCVGAAAPMMSRIEKIVPWPPVFLAAPVTATLCFNLTRRYRNEPKEDVDREGNNQEE
jgi:hypothetical protein